MNYCDWCGKRFEVDEEGRSVVPFLCNHGGCKLGFCHRCVVIEDDKTTTCPSCGKALKRVDWIVK